jgi:hypothetical protein
MAGLLIKEVVQKHRKRYAVSEQLYYKNMKIRVKLFIGFFIVVAIGIFLGVMGFYSIAVLTNLSVGIRNLSGLKSSVSSILS